MNRVDHDIELMRQQIDAQRTLIRTQYVLLRHDIQERAEQTRQTLHVSKRLGALLSGAISAVKLVRGFTGSSQEKRPLWRRLLAASSVISAAFAAHRWWKGRQTD